MLDKQKVAEIMDDQQNQNNQPNSQNNQSVQNNLSGKQKLKNILSKKPYLALAILLTAIVAVSAILLLNMRSDQESAIRTANISITKKGFEPSTIAVESGTKIIWTNKDKKLHQVASNPYPDNDDLPGLKSEILNKDQSYEYIADQTGTFGYHDEIKPTINGVIEVK